MKTYLNIYNWNVHDLQIGDFSSKFFYSSLLNANSENVSEPQTGIEP